MLLGNVESCWTLPSVTSDCSSSLSCMVEAIQKHHRFGGMRSRSSLRLAVWSGLLIFITVMAFNVLGDGLPGALDPGANQD